MSFTQQPHFVTLPALDAFAPPPRREEIDGGRIYQIYGALLPRECRAIIALAESLGFTAAGLAVGDDRYRTNDRARNNERVIIEDRAFARALWERIRGLLEPRHERLSLAGLNWRFRIYRYQIGQYFHPHQDVRMALLGGGETRASLMLYLNEGFTGGETRFFEKKPRSRRARSRKRNNRIQHVVSPRIGAALAFDHLLLHEGSEVRAGVKYAIRTDVIYQ